MRVDKQGGGGGAVSNDSIPADLSVDEGSAKIMHMFETQLVATSNIFHKASFEDWHPFTMLVIIS